MITNLVRTTTQDNFIHDGLLFEPEQKTNKIVIHIHGMAGNFYTNHFIQQEAISLTKNNWALLSGNNRGHDIISEALSEDKKDRYKKIGVFSEKFVDSLLDVKAWINYVQKLGFTEIVLQGHSLGAVKVVYYLVNTNDPNISKLILAAPPDMIALTEKWSDHKETLEVAEKMISEGRGKELVPKMLDDWYYLTAETYADFGKRDNPIDVFNFYDKNKQSILSQVKLPILVVYGQNDDASCVPIPETLEQLKNKAKNSPKVDSVVIEGTGHSYEGKEEEMADAVTHWITK